MEARIVVLARAGPIPERSQTEGAIRNHSQPLIKGVKMDWPKLIVLVAAIFAAIQYLDRRLEKRLYSQLDSIREGVDDVVLGKIRPDPDEPFGFRKLERSPWGFTVTELLAIIAQRIEGLKSIEKPQENR